MPNATPLKPSFNAGELSERLSARTDFDKYNNGASVLENMIPLSEGGAMRRPGTRYVATTKTQTEASDLKPFKFSTTQSYMTEFGSNYIRFFKDQGQISAGATDASVSNGEFTDGSSLWTDISANGGSIAHSSSDGSLALTLTSSSDTAGIEQTITISSSVINNEHVLKFYLNGNAGDKISLQIGGTSSGSDIYSATDKPTGYHCIPFTPGSTSFVPQFRYEGDWRLIDVPSSGAWSINSNLDDISIISDEILELQSPWGSSQVFDIQGPQSADLLYLLHNDTHPYKLTRRGHTDWSLEKIAFTDGPYMDQNNTDTTLSVNSTDGRAVTVTASATEGINSNTGFGSSDIGRVLRISTSSSQTDNWGWGLITGSTSTTTVTVDVKREYPQTAATPDWMIGEWSDETGWPGVGTFHQQRLVLARGTDRPQTMWFSQTGDFENYSPDSVAVSSSLANIWDGTVEDDDSMNYTISSDDVEAIEWMTAGTFLQIGTRNAEWEVTSDGPVITPTDVQVKRHTQRGSARVQPVRVGHATLFLQRAKRRVRELVFSFEVDGLVAADLTRLSPHVTLGGVKKMSYQQEPDSLVWAARNDGQLLCMTYRREEDVVAWSRNIMGGSYGSGDAVVDTIATIPGSTASGQTQDSDDRDELWMVVKRTIDGSTVRYVEFMERAYETGDDQQDSYYSDSLLTYDGSSVTSVTGSSHLSNETVKVLANGAVHSDATVSSSAGHIALDIDSSVVQIGLGYTHRMHTYRLDYGAGQGTAQGQTKRIKAVTASMLNAHTLDIGPSSSQLDKFDFRTVADEMGEAVPFYTGEQFVEMESDWQTDPRIVIESDDPTPFTLLALVPELKTNTR